MAEGHDNGRVTEPRVVSEDVRRVLLRALHPGEPDFGDSVQLIANRAGRSTRTVYRVLDNSNGATISLDLADRLCLAAGGHLSECHLVMPDGRVVPY
jgi:hypothetical protein